MAYFSKSLREKSGGEPTSLRLYRSYVQALDWLFPPQCAGCGKPGSHWCTESQASLRRISEPHCTSCGLPNINIELCDSCQENSPTYVEARSFAYYEGDLRVALLNAKYRRDQALGLQFAQYLDQLLGALKWKIDAIVPIPLSKGRVNERGYNQVEIYARPLALMEEIDYLPKALIRSKETLSQVGLSLDDRWSNLENAFTAKARLLGQKNILLIDDVMTTGATLASAAKSLVTAGAKNVYALTMARAVPEKSKGP